MYARTIITSIECKSWPADREQILQKYHRRDEALEKLNRALSEQQAFGPYPSQLSGEESNAELRAEIARLHLLLALPAVEADVVVAEAVARDAQSE